jgi:hypothetical protein
MTMTMTMTTTTTTTTMISLPRQHQQGQLQEQHSVDNNNYVTEKEKLKHNSHKVIFGNCTVEKLLFLPYITNKGISVLRTRKNANKQEASYEKINKMITVKAIPVPGREGP